MAGRRTSKVPRRSPCTCSLPLSATHAVRRPTARASSWRRLLLQGPGGSSSVSAAPGRTTAAPGRGLPPAAPPTSPAPRGGPADVDTSAGGAALTGLGDLRAPSVEAELVAATDVDNPLLGPNGAS